MRVTPLRTVLLCACAAAAIPTSPPTAAQQTSPGTAFPATATGARPIDLIIAGGRVWTGNPQQPWAEAVAVSGPLIHAVGSRADIFRLGGPDTEIIDMPGRFITPGFIDNHTHFNSAGALLLGANLLDVADDNGLIGRVREARDRLPDGAWLVGGDWGAYEAWGAGSTGREAVRTDSPGFRPHRGAIDSITPETPVLFNKWDRSAYLANGAALRLASADCSWSGVECDNGVPTGRLNAEAAARVRRVIPQKSMDQRLMESRIALRHLNELGVTTIHDNTPPDQMGVFQRLDRNDELTVRIYARPTLDKWSALSAAGISHGFGNDYLKIGGGFVDGIMGNSSAYFYRPYMTGGDRGAWRDMMRNPPGMLELLSGADAAGHWPQIHAIGDQAIDTLLTMFEHVIASNPPRDRRFRIIHTQVLAGPEVARRMARNGIIAEVQPYHAIDDMRWMEERIGERARWAYAFKTLHDAGVVLSFGSDWPGTNASWYTADPWKGVYAAVARQTLDGQPADGWLPEERVDVETALRAYTVNNAWVAGEENDKGALRAGLFADIAVTDRDPFRVPPAELRELRVLLTVVGGRVVYRADDHSNTGGLR
ncbi:amidohydrolase [soil metagenome]